MKTGERVFGIIITTVGIALLIGVFCLAYQMLTHPVPGLKEALTSTNTAPGGTVNVLGGVGTAIADFLLKLAVLFIMTLAGSLIAARGVQLYHGIVNLHHASTVSSLPSTPNAGTQSPSTEATADLTGSGEPTARQ